MPRLGLNCACSMSPSPIGESGIDAVVVEVVVLDDVVVTGEADPPPLAHAAMVRSTIPFIAARHSTPPAHDCRPGLDSFLSITIPLENCTLTTQSNQVPSVGQQAPDFTLKSTSGDKITLSALR